jgi:hypothetical protein
MRGYLCCVLSRSRNSHYGLDDETGGEDREDGADEDDQDDFGKLFGWGLDEDEGEIDERGREEERNPNLINVGD